MKLTKYFHIRAVCIRRSRSISPDNAMISSTILYADIFNDQWEVLVDVEHAFRVSQENFFPFTSIEVEEDKGLSSRRRIQTPHDTIHVNVRSAW